MTVKEPRNSIGENRQSLEALDRMLLELIGARAVLVRELWRLKFLHGLDLVEPAREAGLLLKWRSWGREAGLPADLIPLLFDAVLNLTRPTHGSGINDRTGTGIAP